mmetsp:Transcript_55716/g.129941  ORF Transcript_55716/g.129941 Transcript_55716/m.129941 type:complete len:248 (+) Transcript_55716:590-1333(+)
MVLCRLMLWRGHLAQHKTCQLVGQFCGFLSCRGGCDTSSGHVGRESSCQVLQTFRARLSVHTPLAAVDKRRQRLADSNVSVSDEPLRYVRQALIDDRIVRIIAEPNPFQDCECPRNIKEVRRHPEEVSVTSAQALNFIEEAVHIHCCSTTSQRPLTVDFGKRSDDLALFDILLHSFWHKANANKVGGDRVIVARYQVSDVLDVSHPEAWVEVGHKAPVQNAKPAIWSSQQIAWMRIRVKNSSFQHHR